jgi:hypothetical protein
VKHINHKNGINRIVFLPKMGLVLLATLWIIMMHAVTGVYGALPTAYTYPQVIWNGDSVLLQGAVNPGGKATTVWFECRLMTELWNRTAVTNVGSGNSLVWVRQPLSNIMAGTIYYCQVVASNSSGVVRVAIQMFGKGTVVAWGLNYYGQCNVPAYLRNVVVAVAAGRGHSLTLKVDLFANPPVIMQQPAGTNMVVGGTAVFAVEVSGNLLSYQWYHVTGTSTNLLVGQTNATLMITNVQRTDAGWYYVVVNDPVHTVTSAMAQLVVVAVMRPQIVGSVVSGTVGKLQFMTEPGVVYTLQWAENMNSPINWQDVPGLGATVIGDGTLKMLIDTNASAPCRFYRIKATLP